MEQSRPARRTKMVIVAILVAVLSITASRVQWRRSELHVPVALRVNEAQLRAALVTAAQSTQRFAWTAGASSARIVSATRNGGEHAAGTALAAAIRFSRDRAREAHVRTLSPEIARRLGPFFPAATLSRVRWTLAGRRVSLGTVLAGWYYREGAVSLDDTVVFSNMNTARNLELWAHELTHVRQMEELGLDDFALLYVADWRHLEEQARQNAATIARTAPR